MGQMKKPYAKHFKACNKPKRKPDFVSQSGSKYWYGTKNGKPYEIRQSNHWSEVVGAMEKIPIYTQGHIGENANWWVLVCHRPVCQNIFPNTIPLCGKWIKY